MLNIERYNIILGLLTEKKNIKITEIIEALDISEATARRDLNFLEKTGKLKRVHGGAVLVREIEEDLDFKKVINLDAKDKIAQKAVSFIKDGDTIFLDAGSTTECVIKYLKDFKDIRIVTSGFTFISDLINLGIETYLLGGRIKKRTGAVVGLTATYILENYNFDVVILGANAIDDTGFSTPDPEEALVKEKALSRGGVKLILCDTSKKNKKSFIRFARKEEVILITEEGE